MGRTIEVAVLLRAASLALLLLGCGRVEVDPAPDGGDGGGPVGTDAGGVDAGLCSGVDCSVMDSACAVGMCDPTDGSCVASPLADDTACDDGDPCTTDDACAAGACAGTALDCSAMDGTCTEGVCDPATGACTAMQAMDGTACDDEDVCTSDDVCTAGSCAGDALDCSGLTDDCNVGVCHPTSGVCVADPEPDGTTCDDGDMCTSGETCDRGACMGTPLDCSGVGDTCNVGMCDPTTGSCATTPVMDGTGCDDGDPCTGGDVCTAGVCAGTGSCPTGICGGFNTGPDFNDGSSLGANAIGMAYPATSALTVTGVEIFTGESAGMREIGLWTDAGGEPGTPIATGTWTMSLANGWQGATLSSAVSVTAGTTYWVVWRFMSSDQTPVQTSGTPVTYRGSFDLGMTWNGPFTGPWKFRLLCGP